MKTFKKLREEFRLLLEGKEVEPITEAKNAEKISAGDNTAIATAGEHLTTAHILKAAAAHHEITNPSHAEYLHTKADHHLNQAKELLHGKSAGVRADTDNRAAHVAHKFLQHHVDQGRMVSSIHDVHHTPKQGDIERATGVKTTQTEDTADLVVHYKHKGKDSHQGLSYKNNASNTLGTPGLAGIDKHFAKHGSDMQGHLAKFNAELKKHYPDANNKESRKAIEKEPKAQDIAKKFKEKVAAHYENTFNMAHHDTQKEHLKTIFKMKSKIPTVLVKGHGSGGGYGASLSDPKDDERYKAVHNAKKFSTERRGTNVHYFAHDEHGNKHHLGYSEHRFTHGGFTSFGAPTHSK
jgi:hypothetical protein